ncbi:MAG TPA: hypothetical protein VIX58_05210 [Anaerolineae bacterium]
MYELTLLLQQIARTLPLELDCSEFVAHVPTLVDQTVECRADGRYDMMQQHLFQCRICKEEFVLLEEMVRLERNNFAPQISA